MFGKRRSDAALRTLTFWSFALGLGLTFAQPSLAENCGAYCKARQVRAACHDVAQGQGPTVHQRNLAFERCKRDAIRKDIDEATANSDELSE